MFVEQHLPYHQTNNFSKIVAAYLGAEKNLRPFYAQEPTLQGLKEKIEERKSFPVNRSLLVNVLQEQYRSIPASKAVQQNIEALLADTTFTVCTAHQPNLFTGPLYFIYKILHAIKLAEALKKQFTAYNFVPVYYMGSEDADFAELNHTYVDGKRVEWKKEQKGAVGRMKVDDTLLKLINELEGQLTVEAHGNEVIQLLRQAYVKGKTIQAATLELVNELYGGYGLVVLIPDHPSLKALMNKIVEDDLFNNQPAKLVQQTSDKLSAHYDTQAYPREINLFYLKDDIRERIEKKNERFVVLNTALSFTEEALRKELSDYPERFSPNVILRGLYQEMLLPNLAFIGGGGELAYWLQLKDLFAHYKVPYPVLLLRNSFLVIEEKWKKKIDRLGFTYTDIFAHEDDLMKQIVLKLAQHPVSLNGNVEQADALYENIKMLAGKVDTTLALHVAAIKARSLKALQELEKKMLRAEKRKFGDHQQQIEKMKTALFPNNGLQERMENFSIFYAKWGRSFIDELYKHSLSVEQKFTVLVQKMKN